MDEQTKELILRDFELAPPKESLTEKELFDLLVDQVDYMIQYKMDVLLSLMYRLDINERKVHEALSPLAPEPANVGLARLVLERQKQRQSTKQHYKQHPLEGLDEELQF